LPEDMKKNFMIDQGCQTHFHWGLYQHCGYPQRASCNRINHNHLHYADA